MSRFSVRLVIEDEVKDFVSNIDPVTLSNHEELQVTIATINYLQEISRILKVPVTSLCEYYTDEAL